MNHSLLSLPFEVRLRIYDYYEGPKSSDDSLLTFAPPNDATISPALMYLPHDWHGIISSCRTIREEILDRFRHKYRVRIRPSSVASATSALSQPFRRLYFEIVHKSRSPNFPTSTWDDLIVLVNAAADHPILEELDVAIDVRSMRALVRSENVIKCAAHKDQLMKSSALIQLYQDLDKYCEEGRCFLHFRIHFTEHAAKRTETDTLCYYDHLTENKNNVAGKCGDHQLASCNNVACRLLHTIEEIYDPNSEDDGLDFRLTFPYTSEITHKDQYAFDIYEALSPIVLNAPSIANGQRNLSDNHAWIPSWVSIQYKEPDFSYELRDGEYVLQYTARERFTGEMHNGLPVQSLHPRYGKHLDETASYDPELIPGSPSCSGWDPRANWGLQEN